MMRSIRWMLPLLALAPLGACSAPPAPMTDAPGLANATILVVRHAEKPDEGRDLTPEGQARARAYAAYFTRPAIAGIPLRLDTLIAAADSPQSMRSRLTLTPLARATGLPIRQPFANRDVTGLAAWLQSSPHGRAILIAWHHGEIPSLIAALGVRPDTLLTFGRWPGDVYDQVAVLRFDSHGHPIPGDARIVKEDIAI